MPSAALAAESPARANSDGLWWGGSTGPDQPERVPLLGACAEQHQAVGRGAAGAQCAAAMRAARVRQRHWRVPVRANCSASCNGQRRGRTIATLNHTCTEELTQRSAAARMVRCGAVQTVDAAIARNGCDGTDGPGIRSGAVLVGTCLGPVSTRTGWKGCAFQHAAAIGFKSASAEISMAKRLFCCVAGTSLDPRSASGSHAASCWHRQLASEPCRVCAPGKGASRRVALGSEFVGASRMCSVRT